MASALLGYHESDDARDVPQLAQGRPKRCPPAQRRSGQLSTGDGPCNRQVGPILHRCCGLRLAENLGLSVRGLDEEAGKLGVKGVLGGPYALPWGG